MIGIDWGSSNCRAFRFSPDGAVAERRVSACGIATLKPDAIEASLGEMIGDWLVQDREVLLAGMVGSRSGWVETPYLPSPVGPGALGAALVDVASDLGRCRIVPGVAWRGEDGQGDVMRGEETQVFGSGRRDGGILLPGTHSKWVALCDGRITRIRTAMTGELFALLLQHSLIGQVAEARSTGNEAAFVRGVARSLADPAISMTLFSARAEVLLGRLPRQDVSDTLSGLLIGAEVAAMAAGHRSLTIIGDGALAARYRKALALAGIDDVTLIDGADAAARGLWRIGRMSDDA